MKQWTAEKKSNLFEASRTPGAAKETDAGNEARKRVLRLLEFSDRTEKELTDRLLTEGFTEEETEDAVVYAASFGSVDDLRYACNYIRNRMKEKRRRMLFMDLMRKGVDSETIEAAWSETMLEESQDEGEIIRKFILKKYEAGQELTLKQYRNLCAGLARRGFSYDDIMREFSTLEISFHE